MPEQVSCTRRSPRQWGPAPTGSYASLRARLSPGVSPTHLCSVGYLLIKPNEVTLLTLSPYAESQEVGSSGLPAPIAQIRRLRLSGLPSWLSWLLS